MIQAERRNATPAVMMKERRTYIYQYALASPEMDESYARAGNACIGGGGRRCGGAVGVV